MFTAPDTPGRNRRRRRGLTLLEVVVALAILGLLTGAIYAIVDGSVRSTADLALIQAEDRRLEAFLARARDAFAHLPEGATLELKLLESDPVIQELTLRNVPEAFIWGDNPRWEKAVVTLAPRRLESGTPPPVRESLLRGKGEKPSEHYTLSMTVPDFFRTDGDGEPLLNSPVKSRQGHQLLSPDSEGRFWFELLPSVDRVEWRFYDAAKKIWVNQQPAGRPPMVELQLFLPGRTNPVRAVFATG